ncbi:hypothetical protein PanWU01x14_362520 [Parasponia andersonii]|uniref:Uncharacterized protein n=1 Tax=Parasponia andersonii TaxID=3476 RepID=A0A2P5A6Z8_PARAD|nr:hypothetical protein PanWU01x14_362520 [Parasponia andersonii]
MSDEAAATPQKFRLQRGFLAIRASSDLLFRYLWQVESSFVREVWNGENERNEQFLSELHRTATITRLGLCVACIEELLKMKPTPSVSPRFDVGRSHSSPRKDSASGEVFRPLEHRPTSVFNTSGKWSRVS